jgi:hypothetical protein
MIRKQVWLAALASGIAAAGITVCLQWTAGAWQTGWGTDPDAPAHLVSAIAIREYARDGLPAGRNPFEFGHEFYARFPKVAIGHWPPVYHTMLALWLLAVPPEQPWILGFQALLTGVLSGFTVILASRLLGVRKALLAGVLVCFSPSLATFGRAIAIDLLVAVWVTAGLTAYAYYWRNPHWIPATLFGLCGAAALLTKPTGIILAAVPPLFVLAWRRWSLLKEWSFWWPALIVAILYGPWHLAFAAEMSDGWGPPGRLSTRLVKKPRESVVLLTRVLGAAGTLLALWGAWRWRKREAARILALTVLGGFLMFAYLIPSIGYRHYVSLAPALTILAIGGLWSLLRGFRVRNAGVWLCLLFVLIPVSAPWSTRGSGVRDLVGQLLTHTPAPQTWLVTGTPAFEGDVIAESALRRPSGGLTVYRGSKLFIRGNWDGLKDYLLIGTAEEAEALIERCGIQAVIIGKGTPLLVAEAVGRDPARWKLLRTGLNPEAGLVFGRIGEARPSVLPPIVQKP